ncbi:hypothetical protein [Nonomuraea sp. NPDC050643]|uniref:hypothetical protein n=1 Tax=Nonomuraea sp. NPDC050643 TaxID=3155660 RepID=UPI0033C3908D
MTTDIPPLPDEVKEAIAAYDELSKVLAVPGDGQEWPADRTWHLPPFGAAQDPQPDTGESEIPHENEGA